MQPKWLSTSDFASMVEDHFPATPTIIRELCESGEIPAIYAKRIPGRERGHWRIAVKGIRHILIEILKLEPQEVAEVKAKAPINFNLLAA